jgi:hypothetical protein
MTEVGRPADNSSASWRTVWIVVIGAGGTVPVMGPAGGSPSPIDYQIFLVNDQTDRVIRNSIASG